MMEAAPTNPYASLALNASAVSGCTPGELEDLTTLMYRTLSLIHHPDHGGAETDFQEIARARKVLGESAEVSSIYLEHHLETTSYHDELQFHREYCEKLNTALLEMLEKLAQRVALPRGRATGTPLMGQAPCLLTLIDHNRQRFDDQTKETPSAESRKMMEIIKRGESIISIDESEELQQAEISEYGFKVEIAADGTVTETRERRSSVWQDEFILGTLSERVALFVDRFTPEDFDMGPKYIPGTAPKNNDDDTPSKEASLHLIGHGGKKDFDFGPGRLEISQIWRIAGSLLPSLSYRRFLVSLRCPRGEQPYLRVVGFIHEIDSLDESDS